MDYMYSNHENEVNFFSEPCGSMPCGANGNCTANAPASGSTMATYTCTCESGFFGDNCDQGTNMYTVR